jgi:hypothetical protein
VKNTKNPAGEQDLKKRNDPDKLPLGVCGMPCSRTVWKNARETGPRARDEAISTTDHMLSFSPSHLATRLDLGDTTGERPTDSTLKAPRRCPFQFSIFSSLLPPLPNHAHNDAAHYSSGHLQACCPGRDDVGRVCRDGCCCF